MRIGVPLDEVVILFRKINYNDDGNKYQHHEKEG
jgi:hypothetical protein